MGEDLSIEWVGSFVVTGGGEVVSSDGKIVLWLDGDEAGGWYFGGGAVD